MTQGLAPCCTGDGASGLGINPQQWEALFGFAVSLCYKEQSPCLQVGFFFFGSQIGLVLALGRQQEKSCTSWLPLSVTINLICVQQDPFPLVHTMQQHCNYSSFYINQSLFNFSLYWIWPNPQELVIKALQVQLFIWINSEGCRQLLFNVITAHGKWKWNSLLFIMQIRQQTRSHLCCLYCSQFWKLNLQVKSGKVFSTARKTLILKYSFLNYLSFSIHMAVV